jgi:hypothetical protein
MTRIDSGGGRERRLNVCDAWNRVIREKVDLPITKDGAFDLGLMKAWTEFFERVEKTTGELRVATT